MFLRNLEKQHRKDTKCLLEKIEKSNAIMVGAAAGMSASCGYNFFYSGDALFHKYY